MSAPVPDIDRSYASFTMAQDQDMEGFFYNGTILRHILSVDTTTSFASIRPLHCVNASHIFHVVEQCDICRDDSHSRMRMRIVCYTRMRTRPVRRYVAHFGRRRYTDAFFEWESWHVSISEHTSRRGKCVRMCPFTPGKFSAQQKMRNKNVPV